MNHQRVSCIVAGDSGAGKTSLLTWLSQHTVEEFYNPTIGIDYFVTWYKNVRIHTWDTAGAERFRSIVSSYFRGIDVCLLVFDVQHRASFRQIPSWWEHAIHNGHTGTFVLVGTKAKEHNGQRQVSAEEANSFATRIQATYVEVSALQDYNRLGLLGEIVTHAPPLISSCDVSVPTRPPRQCCTLQ